MRKKLLLFIPGVRIIQEARCCSWLLKTLISLCRSLSIIHLWCKGLFLVQQKLIGALISACCVESFGVDANVTFWSDSSRMSHHHRRHRASSFPSSSVECPKNEIFGWINKSFFNSSYHKMYFYYLKAGITTFIFNTW